MSPGESRARVCGWVPSAGQVSLSVPVGWGDTAFYATEGSFEMTGETANRNRGREGRFLPRCGAPHTRGGSTRAAERGSGREMPRGNGVGTERGTEQTQVARFVMRSGDGGGVHLVFSPG